MKSRIHLTLQDDAGHLFKHIGKDVPHVEAQKFNPYTKPYTGICGTIGHETEDTSFEATFDERYERNPDGSWKFAFRVPHVVVMRGQVQCECCGPQCFHCGDNVTAATTGTVPMATNDHVGSEYCEAVLDLITLQPLAREASQKLGDKAYAKQLSDSTASLGLDASWLQLHIPYLQGKVADVFAATSTYASDIFYVAAFLNLILHRERGWIKTAHNKLSRDWPQRPARNKPTAADIVIPK